MRALYPLVLFAIFPVAYLYAPRPTIEAEARAASAVSLPAATTREAWAVDLLARLGNREPSREIVTFVVTWTQAEDSGPGAIARNNALNTTLCLPGRMTGAINGDGACGVQGYLTWQDGIEATARTLEQGNFSPLRLALLANDAERAKQELFNSPWAESHYGYGASWPKE